MLVETILYSLSMGGNIHPALGYCIACYVVTLSFFALCVRMGWDTEAAGLYIIPSPLVVGVVLLMSPIILVVVAMLVIASTADKTNTRWGHESFHRR